jgi:hypothetical protein
MIRPGDPNPSQGEERLAEQTSQGLWREPVFDGRALPCPISPAFKPAWGQKLIHQNLVLERASDQDFSG